MVKFLRYSLSLFRLFSCTNVKFGDMLFINRNEFFKFLPEYEKRK